MFGQGNIEGALRDPSFVCCVTGCDHAEAKAVVEIVSAAAAPSKLSERFCISTFFLSSIQA
jgi:hypothetical protein